MTRSERNKRYYKQNQKTVLDRVKKYRDENPEKIKVSKRRDYEKHRDAYLERARTSRLKRRAILKLIRELETKGIGALL